MKTAMLAVAVLAALASPAAAASPLPQDSGISQYVESVPSGGGPAEPGAGKPTSPAGRLSPRASKLLTQQGGPDAPALRRIATSPDLGAPAGATSVASPGALRSARTGRRDHLAAPGGSSSSSGRPTTLARSGPGALSAATAALGDGAWPLLAALGALIGTAAFVLIRRRRRSGTADGEATLIRRR